MRGPHPSPSRMGPDADAFCSRHPALHSPGPESQCLCHTVFPGASQPTVPRSKRKWQEKGGKKLHLQPFSLRFPQVPVLQWGSRQDCCLGARQEGFQWRDRCARGGCVNTQTHSKGVRGARMDLGTKKLGLGRKGYGTKGTQIRRSNNSLKGVECVDTEKASGTSEPVTGRWAMEAREQLAQQQCRLWPWPGERQARPVARHLRLHPASRPQPRGNGSLWLLPSLLWFSGLLAFPEGTVSKGWSLPIPPGTEPCPPA